MNNRLFAFTVFCFSIIVFSSCSKTGDNDPIVSFRSRKSRLCGEWKVEFLRGSYEYQQVIAGGNNIFGSPPAFERIFTIGSNGTYQKFVSNNNYPNGISYSGDFEWRLKFSEDGSFQHNFSMNGASLSMPGKWRFSSDEAKVEITLDSAWYYFNSQPFVDEFFTRCLVTTPFQLDELRNNKITMVSSPEPFPNTTFVDLQLKMIKE